MGRSVVAKIVWDQRGRRVPTSVADAAPDTVVTKKDNDRGSTRRGGSAPRQYARPASLLTGYRAALGAQTRATAHPG
jgi:hypothetical protein